MIEGGAFKKAFKFIGDGLNDAFGVYQRMSMCEMHDYVGPHGAVWGDRLSGELFNIHFTPLGMRKRGMRLVKEDKPSLKNMSTRTEALLQGSNDLINLLNVLNEKRSDLYLIQTLCGTTNYEQATYAVFKLGFHLARQDDDIRSDLNILKDARANGDNVSVYIGREEFSDLRARVNNLQASYQESSRRRK